MQACGVNGHSGKGQSAVRPGGKSAVRPNATTRVDVSCSARSRPGRNPSTLGQATRYEVTSLSGIPRCAFCRFATRGGTHDRADPVIAGKAGVAQMHAIGPVPGSNGRPRCLSPSLRSHEGRHVSGRAVPSSVCDGSAVASGINGSTGPPGGSSSCAPAPAPQHIKDMHERARVGSGLTTAPPRARYQSSRTTPPPAKAVATGQRRRKPRCTYLAVSVVPAAASPQQPYVQHGWDADR